MINRAVLYNSVGRHLTTFNLDFVLQQIDNNPGDLDFYDDRWDHSERIIHALENGGSVEFIEA